MDLKELKRKARGAIRANYLPCVLAALIIAVVVEGSTNIFSNMDLSSVTSDSDTSSAYGMYMIGQQIIMFLAGHLPASFGLLIGFMVLNGGGFISSAIAVLVSNIAEVGCDRFFVVNSSRKAYINELGYGFKKKRYFRTMMIQIYREAYIILWSLLLIVPGIIRAYDYRLVPYLLAEEENSKMKVDEMLAKSKEMMLGHRKEAFLLDLSFLGWDILGACTFGILSVLWVNPYKYASRAQFYEALRGPVSGSSSYDIYKKSQKSAFDGYHAYQKKNRKK